MNCRCTWVQVCGTACCWDVGRGMLDSACSPRKPGAFLKATFQELQGCIAEPSHELRDPVLHLRRAASTSEAW